MNTLFVTTIFSSCNEIDDKVEGERRSFLLLALQVPGGVEKGGGVGAAGVGAAGAASGSDDSLDSCLLSPPISTFCLVFFTSIADR